MVLDLAILVIFGAAKAEPFDVFFYFATIGTLSLLAMYVLTNVAATRFLAAKGARLELLLPLAGIAVALYVLYHNVYPVPDVSVRRLPLRGGGVAGHRDRADLLAPRLIA